MCAPSLLFCAFSLEWLLLACGVFRGLPIPRKNAEVPPKMAA
jgi:hypothetical protein